MRERELCGACSRRGARLPSSSIRWSGLSLESVGGSRVSSSGGASFSATVNSFQWYREASAELGSTGPRRQRVRRGLPGRGSTCEGSESADGRERSCVFESAILCHGTRIGAERV